MNGVLVVDKPAGPTSHDVVAVARRALGVRRIGHTGTLDPFATGVLPLVVGRATRLAQFLTATDKEYVAAVRFGAASPTYDAEGVDRAPGPVDVDRAAIERRLEEFRGTYLQTPPPFSAKKVGGVPAYRHARVNQPVALKPVTVTVSSLALESFEGGRAIVRMVSSSGFYVRVFAHELGRRLGCGGYLEALRRTRAGDFGLEAAVTLDTVVAEGAGTAGRLVSMDRLLPMLPAAVLTEVGTERALHGSLLSPGDFSLQYEAVLAGDAGRVRLLDGSGHLVAIAECRPGGLLHPAVVLV
jgi:tRNA pseudouridine55 synthase